ncbi:hypothetical protein LRD18_12595 [Halorhodospira halochloris]|uniref:hypothetical protein n=1 Tax=Halorhodospira halochloris TaxID=1052 RepID=UPI001EE99D51|nr:hypothetical protein [Halorhodospira halochloris]MCG5531675.1 hypothetical protein [Halorhodospira halochloris]
MARVHRLLWAAGAVGGLFVVAGAAALLGDRDTTAPQPEVSADGECITDAEQMRREHPHLLAERMHQSVREGKRDAEQSMHGCVDCHATPPEEQEAGADSMQFCSSCHEYTGVQTGCFNCHADGSNPDNYGSSPDN